ncbi:MAG: AraC family transcriptional regulator [Thermomicrobiales bacterium]
MGEAAVDFRSEWSRKLTVSGARVSEIKFHPDQFCPKHWHKHPSLGIVIQGVVVKEFAKATVVIESSGGFAMPAGILHSDHFGPGSRVVIIEIDPEHPISAQRLEVCGPIFERWHKFDDQRLSRLGQRLVRELRRPDDATSMAVDGLVGEILSVATRCNGFTSESDQQDLPDWLIEARDYARSELNRRISVPEIAERVGVHPAYLARRFRSEFGVTPAAYARNARLNWASERLIETDLSIAEIAIQAGFSDQSHFTRAFKRFVDLTPAQYRDSFQNNSGMRG